MVVKGWVTDLAMDSAHSRNTSCNLQSHHLCNPSILEIRKSLPTRNLHLGLALALAVEAAVGQPVVRLALGPA